MEKEIKRLKEVAIRWGIRRKLENLPVDYILQEARRTLYSPE